MYATFNKLPRSSLPTATFLLRLNNLLDVLNSSTRFNTCSTRRAISNIHPVTADEHIKILVDGEAWLRRWTVGDGASIDSVRGLIQTIKGVQEVWKLCQAAGCTFLCTLHTPPEPRRAGKLFWHRAAARWGDRQPRSHPLSTSVQARVSE